jgi:hypothetical protein
MVCRAIVVAEFGLIYIRNPGLACSVLDIPGMTQGWYELESRDAAKSTRVAMRALARCGRD